MNPPIFSAAVAAAILFASPALASPPKVVDETGQRVDLTPNDDTHFRNPVSRRDYSVRDRGCVASGETPDDSNSEHLSSAPAPSSSGERRSADACCRR